MLNYLYLKPTLWAQSVRSYSSNDPGTILTVSVRPLPDTELSWKDGGKVKDYDISLSIIPGDLSPEEAQKRSFSPDALGGLWYIEEDNFIHGWFFFKRHNYEALWDQVKTGGYQDCTITLGVMLEEQAVWTENPLSIVSADIRFDRRLISRSAEQQKPSRKGWFG